MKNKTVIAGIALLVAGLAAGYFIGLKVSSDNEVVVVTQGEKQKTDIKQTRLGKTKFTNPLLECDCTMPDELIATGYLKQDIADYIAKVIGEGRASHVSVYFRDLNNGPWLGLGEQENFTPASLLKVPMMIAALKKAEGNPLFLQKKIRCTEPKENEYGPNVNDSVTLIIGKFYTVEELIRQMIRHSDNRALQFLMQEVGMKAYEQVFLDMQVISPVDQSNDNVISVKEYSSFFRILYNASYLNKELSEKALKILSESSFRIGLTAQLPASVTVAHKYGERGFEGSGNVQLHDCGIVYSDKAPYLICVMTRGGKFKDLSSVIADVSAMVFRSVNAQ